MPKLLKYQTNAQNPLFVDDRLILHQIYDSNLPKNVHNATEITIHD